MHTTCIPAAHQSQKRASEPLELGVTDSWEPPFVVEIEPRSSSRAASALNHQMRFINMLLTLLFVQIWPGLLRILFILKCMVFLLSFLVDF